MVTGQDVAVLGAGVIGLSLALELSARGWRVQVFENAPVGARRKGQASSAAAGMLAVDDPHHPAALKGFARRSGNFYDEFLRRVREASGFPVPYQTTEAVEYAGGGKKTLAERSLDPRQLMEALAQAVLRAGVAVRHGAEVLDAQDEGDAVRMRLASGESVVTDRVVFAGGAWLAHPAIRPRKGQMLRVALPQGCVLEQVHRSDAVYVVPRRYGPQAGTALIGATVEDVGFDTHVDEAALRSLRAHAAEMLPELGDERATPQVEAWAGLRPGSADDLPLLGAVPGSTRQFLACGHFRNGILLAPATAVAMADLLEGRTFADDLSAFSPTRFGTVRTR